MDILSILIDLLSFTGFAVFLYILFGATLPQGTTAIYLSLLKKHQIIRIEFLRFVNIIFRHLQINCVSSQSSVACVIVINHLFLSRS